MACVASTRASPCRSTTYNITISRWFLARCRVIDKKDREATTMTRQSRDAGRAGPSRGPPEVAALLVDAVRETLCPLVGFVPPVGSLDLRPLPLAPPPGSVILV